MNILFIVNPTAGRDKARSMIPIIKAKLDDTEHRYKIVTTKRPREAVSLAVDGLKDGFETVVAVGGDGTVNEVAEGVLSVGSGNLGIIPGGTGNDLARTLSIPLNPNQAIDTIIRSRIIRMNIGKIEDKVFLNVASVGFDSEIVKNTEKVKKYFKGKFAYTIGLLVTLIRYKSKKGTLEIDDNHLDMDFLLLAVANGKYYGGGMKISPMAEIDDDFFHVCAIKKISKVKLLTIFPSVFKGNHIKHDKYVKFYKCKKISLEIMEKVYLNIDGEVFDMNQRVDFTIGKEKINVISI